MTRIETIAALRLAADKLEAATGLPEDRYYFEVCCPGETKDNAAAFIRAFGKVEKEYSLNNLHLRHYLSDSVASGYLYMLADRKNVCTMKVTTKHLPAEPEKVIPAQPERDVEVVEWECPESILAESVK